MLSFIVRRILASILTLIVASYIMYILTAYSGNPLEDLLGADVAARSHVLALFRSPDSRFPIPDSRL